MLKCRQPVFIFRVVGFNAVEVGEATEVEGVSGGGGAPLYDTGPNHEQNPYNQVVFSKHHYCLVQATVNEFNLSVYDGDGEILDKINLSFADSVKTKQAISK